MTRRSRRDLLAAVGGTVVALGRTRRATASSTSFDTDFDAPTEQLAAQGWRATNGSFSTVDSHLVSDGRGGDEFNIAREQTAAAGTLEMRGVQNTARFYGLRIAFIADATRVSDARGYAVNWVQDRDSGRDDSENWGDILLRRLDPGDGDEVLAVLSSDHDGRVTDVRIERDPETWAFTCYLDGEQVATVQDDTYTRSKYWVHRHDAGAADQRVDGVAVDPSIRGFAEPGSRTSGDPYVTDFDHPPSALDDQGWTVEHGTYRTEDSHLVADGGAGNLDYQLSRPQPSAAGTFEFRGVRNEHPFYGLRFAFVSDAPTFGGASAAAGTQRGYQIVLRNTQDGGPVELKRTDGDGVETLLTLAEDHGGDPVDVRVERDPDTWTFDCYLDGDHAGRVRDDTYTTSDYWVQKHGAGDSQRVDGIAIRPDSSETSPAPDVTAPPGTPPGSDEASVDWLDGWYALVAWFVGVPLLGPIVLGALVAADRRIDDGDGTIDDGGGADDK